jgi:hypothetical protein
VIFQSNFSVKQTNLSLEKQNNDFSTENQQLKSDYDKVLQQEKVTSRNLESAKIKISQLGIDSDNQVFNLIYIATQNS